MNNIKEYKDLFLPGAIVFAALVMGGSIIYLANMGGGSVPERAGATVQRAVSTNAVDNDGSTVSFTIGANDHI